MTRQPGHTAELERIQRLFYRAVTWPTGVADFLEHADAETRREFAELFVGSPEFPAAARVDVYADAYFYRLLSALREMFPRLAALAGSAQFHDLVTDFVLAHPPDEPNLRGLGRRLPAFVARHALGVRSPLLADVAALERCLDEALDAGDAPLVAEADLADLPAERWPELELRFVPCAARLESRWDLEQVLGLAAGGQHERALALQPGAAEPYLVSRRGHAPYFRRLAAQEDCCFCAFRCGASLARVCGELARRHPEHEPAHVVQDLRRWIAEGLVSDFTPRVRSGAEG